MEQAVARPGQVHIGFELHAQRAGISLQRETGPWFREGPAGQRSFARNVAFILQDRRAAIAKRRGRVKLLHTEMGADEIVFGRPRLRLRGRAEDQPGLLPMAGRGHDARGDQGVVGSAEGEAKLVGPNGAGLSMSQYA